MSLSFARNPSVTWPVWLRHQPWQPDRHRVWLHESLGLAPHSSGGHPGPRLSPKPDLQDDDTIMTSSYHVPVLAREVMHFLTPGPNKLFLDGTLGGGGHTEMLLRDGASVLALDQDPDALDYARERLSDYEDRVALVHMNFRRYPDLLREVGLERELDGILLDLGISSWQIDQAERGFSFQQDGPLDMRMNHSAGATAADLVNSLDEDELRRILRDYGDEPQAGRIVSAIGRRRKIRPFLTTGDLASFVEELCGRRSGKHPATRTFQALRIAVNDEMNALREALSQVHQWLKPGGRLAVITFHSLEDRIVKQFLQHESQPLLDRPEWPAPRKNPDHHFKLVVKKPIEASEEELVRNPRARSAKLRVAERIPFHAEALA
jgi:16S rRNA (cytosine1402-N4)-methyltransferase